jgi:hypothetical protein
VGVSVAIPNTSYSLSGHFTSGGKFFIILAFLFGKNRALPETSDPVIQFSFPALERILRSKEALKGDKTGIVKSPMRDDSKRNTVNFRETSEYETRDTDADFDNVDDSLPKIVFGL